MTDKASPAGWVVQVMTHVELTEPTAIAVRRYNPTLLEPPSFNYYNVAIAAPDKAVEATAKKLAITEPKGGEICVVRELSSGEVAALNLKSGEVRPA